MDTRPKLALPRQAWKSIQPSSEEQGEQRKHPPTLLFPWLRDNNLQACLSCSEAGLPQVGTRTLPEITRYKLANCPQASALALTDTFFGAKPVIETPQHSRRLFTAEYCALNVKCLPCA